MLTTDSSFLSVVNLYLLGFLFMHIQYVTYPSLILVVPVRPVSTSVRREYNLDPPKPWNFVLLLQQVDIDT
jgi:hypothetical protein